MSAESVGRGKMQIFRAILLASHLIRCLAGDASSDCGRRNERDCVIEATYGNSLAGEKPVDGLVNCATHDELLGNKFALANEINWNGCGAWENLDHLGLRMIPRKNRVNILRIEKFVTGYLTSGTFDGFSGLEFLSLRSNSIRNLSSSCFRGLKNLTTLEMMDNQLKWMDSGLLTDVPRLKTLKVHDREHLLMANHQFREYQIADYVELEIYYFGIELLEHLLGHVRNLSMLVKLNDDVDGCDQTRLNGYEKGWIVERLRLENIRCGFVMENVDAIEQLELVRALQLSSSELRLKDLRELETISLHQNILADDFAKFEGNFTSLQKFRLFNNTMTEIDMRAFEPFDNLRELHLEGNFLSKLGELRPRKFANVRLFVDGNDFECSWLDDIATTRVFHNFVFTENFKGFNKDGLSCRYDRNCPEYNDTECSSCLVASANIEAQRELRMVRHDNFILKPEIFMIIVCASSLLGMALTFISIYVYHKRRMLKQEPFYHSLRDSMMRPVHDVRSTLKEIISRNLPPTNYEHPISDSNVTEMSDVAANIYEEIPQEHDERPRTLMEW